MNIESEMKKFSALESEQKKQACLTILDKAKASGGLFLELYELISSGNASDKVLSDVYESAMVVLNESEETKVEIAIETLRSNQGELKKALEREKFERTKESQEVGLSLHF